MAESPGAMIVGTFRPPGAAHRQLRSPRRGRGLVFDGIIHITCTGEYERPNDDQAVQGNSLVVARHVRGGGEGGTEPTEALDL
jgi:hypothetical protein